MASDEIKRPTGPITDLKLQSISVSHRSAEDGADPNEFLRIVGTTRVSTSGSGQREKQTVCQLPTVSIELARQEWCFLQILADHLATLQKQIARIAPRSAHNNDTPNLDSSAMAFHLGIDTARLKLVFQDASSLSASAGRVEASLVESQPATIKVAIIEVSSSGISGPCGHLKVELADKDKQSALVVQYFADGERIGAVSPQIVVRLSSLSSSLDISQALKIGANVAAFLVAPDGIFEEVAPAERTTLSISADNAEFTLFDESDRNSFKLDCLSISCDVDLESVAGRQQIHGRWGELSLSLQNATSDKRSLASIVPPTSNAAPLIEVRDGQAMFLCESAPIKRQRCELARAETIIHLCADTIQVIDGIAKGFKAKMEQVEVLTDNGIDNAAPAPMAPDLSASHAVQSLSPPLNPETLFTGRDDMLTDDVPARLEFLHRGPAEPQDVLASFVEEGTSHKRKAPHSSPSRSSRSDADVLLASNTTKARTLHSKGIIPRFGYYRDFRKASRELQPDP